MESIFPGGRPIPSKSYQFNDKLKLVIKRAFSNTHTHTHKMAIILVLLSAYQFLNEENHGSL